MAAGVQAWEQVSRQIEGSEQAREFLEALREGQRGRRRTWRRSVAIDVVLATSDLPDMGQLARANRDQITAILQNRKVLFSAGRMDVTQAVLIRLNANG